MSLSYSIAHSVQQVVQAGRDQTATPPLDACAGRQQVEKRQHRRLVDTVTFAAEPISEYHVSARERSRVMYKTILPVTYLTIYTYIYDTAKYNPHMTVSLSAAHQRYNANYTMRILSSDFVRFIHIVFDELQQTLWSSTLHIRW